jgi:transposase
MCLRAMEIGEVPTETARVARATYKRGHDYVRLRDHLGTFYTDADFAPLYPRRGQPALAPWRLAVVSVLQVLEGLPDRQAAEMVRSRIDWKYVLGLEMTDPGFDFSVLSEFRARVIAGGAEGQLLDQVLRRLEAAGLCAAGGRQRADSTHVLGAIRVLNRLECVGETLRQALNQVAAVLPTWLQAHAPTAWYERYGARMEASRLPQGARQRLAFAELVGQEGQAFLALVEDPTAPSWLRELPAVQLVRQVWAQQYEPTAAGPRWREDGALPPAGALIQSPYDPEAHYSKKRDTTWVGYKVHLTETCEAGLPHVITQVTTTPAPVPDGTQTGPIQADLARRHLLPRQLVVDPGYVDAAQVVAARQVYGVDLLGPVPADTSWQTQAGAGFGCDEFTLDWDAQTARCPQGHVSRDWRPSQDRHGHPVARVRFALADCRPCPARVQCTHAATGPRKLTLRPREEHAALRQIRARQATPEFKTAYQTRAGIEGTLSQGARSFGLRRAKYRGLPKVHLQHVLTAIALTLARVMAWLGGTPLGRTQRSAFAALAPVLL